MLDVDGNGTLDALTDGLLNLRWQFGFSGQTLIANAVGAGCTRCTAGEIEGYLSSIESQLDIDGNGIVGALTDGLLALRFLFGFSGDVLVSGAVDLLDCTRCDAAAIELYPEGLT